MSHAACCMSHVACCATWNAARSHVCARSQADAEAEEADAGDFMAQLNPQSKLVHAAFAEPALRGVQPMERFQFERSGYECWLALRTRARMM